VWTPATDVNGHVTGWTAHDIDPRPDVISESYAINGRGQVSGAGYPADGTGGQSQAFLWTPHDTTGGIGRLEVLPYLPGTVESEANDINDDGVVVGYCSRGVGSDRAVLWQGHSAAVDLNQFVAGSGWTLLSANSINNHGDIVGYGMRDGQYRAFMLVPVETHHTPFDDLRRQIFAQLVYILYGVRLGEGGAVFTPPNRPVPVPPSGDPFALQQLKGRLRDALLRTSADPKAAKVPRAALEQARKDINRMLG
jgi:probable HAF family extracellular repeat protein